MPKELWEHFRSLHGAGKQPGNGSIPALTTCQFLIPAPPPGAKVRGHTAVGYYVYVRELSPDFSPTSSCPHPHHFCGVQVCA